MDTFVKMGDIVLYNHSGSADGKFPPMQSPAIVMKVWEDGELDLFVLSNRATKNAGNGQYFAHDIQHKDQVGEGKTSWSHRA